MLDMTFITKQTGV